MASWYSMGDRTRTRAGKEDRTSISSQEDYHPTKKSRDSSHQWTVPEGFSACRIKSLMDIDFDMGNPGNRMGPPPPQMPHRSQFMRNDMEPDIQNGQSHYPVASLMDVHLLPRARQQQQHHQPQHHQPQPQHPQPTGFHANNMRAMTPQGFSQPQPGPMMPPYMYPMQNNPQPSNACMSSLPYQQSPYPSPVTPLMPLQSAPCPPQMPRMQQTPMIPQRPVPMAPVEKFTPTCMSGDDDDGIPSLLDLPLGGQPVNPKPPSLLPGLPTEEAEFEQLMERLCISARTKLPMCCVSPVKSLETALQRCNLPRGMRKYKPLQSGSPMLCKLYCNNLLIGVGVGDTARAADAKAYNRALQLLRETSFEDVLFGQPLRNEMTDVMANMPQRQPESPNSQSQFVVLEDRKPESGSNSFYILMLSAQFCGCSVSLVTDREDSGRCCVKVVLDGKEIASATGNDEMATKRNASNEALIKLKSTCPIIKLNSNGDLWKNGIYKAIKSKVKETIDSFDSYMAKPRSCDDPIFVSPSHMNLKSPFAALSVNDLEELLCEILDKYIELEIINPLVIAPMPARSQRLLLFRLARQRSLCTETIRLSQNLGHDLALVPAIRRQIDASVILPILKSVDGHKTEQFELCTEGLDLEEQPTGNDVEAGCETTTK